MARYDEKHGYRRSRKFTFFKSILGIFKKKPQIIDLNKEWERPPFLIISNHSGASGPLTMEICIDKFFCFWGAHQMCEGVKSRWNYLYHKFYQKSLHYKKPRAFFIATLFAPFSKMLYRATEVIPTYSDTRLLNTFNKSFEKLDEGKSILIFPEDSSTGYHMPLQKYNAGFATLCKMYLKRSGKDLPVYPICYDKSNAKLVISTPIYVNKLLNDGKTEKEVAEMAKDITNNLFNTYIKKEEPKLELIE